LTLRFRLNEFNPLSAGGHFRDLCHWLAQVILKMSANKGSIDAGDLCAVRLLACALERSYWPGVRAEKLKRREERPNRWRSCRITSVTAAFLKTHRLEKCEWRFPQRLQRLAPAEAAEKHMRRSASLTSKLPSASLRWSSVM
jgi:hypothetical protein